MMMDERGPVMDTRCDFEVCPPLGSCAPATPRAKMYRWREQVNIGDLDIKLGLDIERDGVVLATKDNWGYSAALFSLFSGAWIRSHSRSLALILPLVSLFTSRCAGQMRKLFLWLLGGASFKTFLSQEMKRVLVDRNTVKVTICALLLGGFMR